MGIPVTFTAGSTPARVIASGSLNVVIEDPVRGLVLL